MADTSKAAPEPRCMTVMVLEDGSAVLEIAGKKPIAFSAEEFESLQRMLRPLPAMSLAAIVEMTPFPPIESLYGAMQDATIKAGA